MGIEEYLAEIKNQIRDKTAREFASNELKAHIEDRTEGLKKKGMDQAVTILALSLEILLLTQSSHNLCPEEETAGIMLHKRVSLDI